MNKERLTRTLNEIVAFVLSGIDLRIPLMFLMKLSAYLEGRKIQQNVCTARGLLY